MAGLVWLALLTDESFVKAFFRLIRVNPRNPRSKTAWELTADQTKIRTQERQSIGTVAAGNLHAAPRRVISSPDLLRGFRTSVLSIDFRG